MKITSKLFHWSHWQQWWKSQPVGRSFFFSSLFVPIEITQVNTLLAVPERITSSTVCSICSVCLWKLVCYRYVQKWDSVVWLLHAQSQVLKFMVQYLNNVTKLVCEAPVEFFLLGKSATSHLISVNIEPCRSFHLQTSCTCLLLHVNLSPLLAWNGEWANYHSSKD